MVIFYATAYVDRPGRAHFFDDVYGHDARLRDALANGYPYPRALRRGSSPFNNPTGVRGRSAPSPVMEAPAFAPACRLHGWGQARPAGGGP